MGGGACQICRCPRAIDGGLTLRQHALDGHLVRRRHRAPRRDLEAERNGLQRHAGIHLHREMQVRTVAVAGIAGIGDPLTAIDLAAGPDAQAVGLEVCINGHGAVIMQYPDFVGARQVAFLLASAVEIVLHVHHLSRARRQNRCADRHGDVDGVLVCGIMVRRGVDETAKEQLGAAYDKAARYCQDVRQYSVSPGNFAGGLTTIEEKSMGAFAKSGSRPIQGVIRVAEKPPRPGLWVLDSVPDPHFMGFGYTNPNDTEGIMDLISVGSHIVLFVTGRGSVIGSPVAPLLKVTGNSQTFERMKDDMDFNAGRVLSGELTLEEAGRDLQRLVLDVARGAPSKPEALGHREYFIMYKHQDTPLLEIGCRA